MKRRERLDQILLMLNEQGELEVEPLATYFDVSVETIRRDLSDLSEKGLLRKVHGGAVKFQTAREHSFQLRSHLYHTQKTAIAQHAITLLKPDDSLLINAGTTTAVFATELAKTDLSLTVFTNSSLVAYELSTSQSGHFDIYLLGGKFRSDDYETGGAMVIEQIQQFHADHAILTVGAISAQHGVMEYRVDAVQIARAMMVQARHITVIADDSKLDDTALNKICEISQIDHLVTSAKPSAKLAKALESGDVKLHIVD